MREFSDRRYLLVRPDDPRTPLVWDDDSCGVQQDEDGPALLVVGARVSNERCHRAAARFGLDPRAILTFRDLEAVEA